MFTALSWRYLPTTVSFSFLMAIGIQDQCIAVWVLTIFASSEIKWQKHFPNKAWEIETFRDYFKQLQNLCWHNIDIARLCCHYCNAMSYFVLWHIFPIANGEYSHVSFKSLFLYCAVQKINKSQQVRPTIILTFG